MFTAVVEQHARASLLRGGTVPKKPRLAVRLPDSSIHLRALNDDATGWDASDWVQLASKYEGADYSLRAFAEVDQTSLWLFVGTVLDSIDYRIFDLDGTLKSPLPVAIGGGSDEFYAIKQRPAACSASDGGVHLFVSGGPEGSEVLWHRSFQSEWSDWNPLPVPPKYINAEPVVVAMPSGQIEIIVRTSYSPTELTGNSIAHMQFRQLDGSSAAWNWLPDLPQGGIKDITACSWGEGRLDVFVLMTDGSIQHSWRHEGFHTGWSDWDAKEKDQPGVRPGPRGDTHGLGALAHD
jgi:hypothetical protein